MGPETTPHVITSLLALGMALAFIVADRRSPTSQAIALFFCCIGIAIATTVLVGVGAIRRATEVPVWGGIYALPETLAFVFAFEWVLRVRRTVPARNLRTRGPDNLLRIAQALAALYGLLSLLFPDKRAQYFTGALSFEAGGQLHPEFFLFAGPLAVSLVLGVFSGLVMFRRRPDRAETRRLLAFVIATPFLASGMVIPANLAPIPMAVGMLIFLVGAVQYHVTQGRRAQFLSRFLAPQVADLVRERGLKSATDEKTVELSVVYCDLRGFTAFSEATSSRKVISILRQYYDAVGAAAAEYGGTIKDQAGDGVLILVGAPVAFADHAHRALELARRIRDSSRELTARWSDAELRLGVGVGVASGYVTVGVIGAASRLEYTAVGPAVNLAARLCAEAAPGEVLVDARTGELLGSEEGRGKLLPGQALLLKGFPLPVQSYILPAA